MGGAGSLPAGSPFAGFETPAAPSMAEAPTHAPAYDPTQRSIPLDASGAAERVHWVDQSVALAISVPLGSLPGRPELGIDRAQLATATRANVEEVVTDAVHRALATLMRQSAIEILAIRVLQFGAGRLVFELRYANMLIPAQRTRSVIVSA